MLATASADWIRLDTRQEIWVSQQSPGQAEWLLTVSDGCCILSRGSSRREVIISQHEHHGSVPRSLQDKDSIGLGCTIFAGYLKSQNLRRPSEHNCRCVSLRWLILVLICSSYPNRCYQITTEDGSDWSQLRLLQLLLTLLTQVLFALT